MKKLHVLGEKRNRCGFGGKRKRFGVVAIKKQDFGGKKGVKGGGNLFVFGVKKEEIGIGGGGA